MTRKLHISKTLAKQVRTIYFDSFPPSERTDFSDIVASVTNKTRWLFTAMRVNSLIGFAITMPLQNVDVHYLEYLAIAKETRSQGFGSTFLQAVLDTLRTTENASGLIFEVESDDYGTEQERQLRKRRIQFYRKNGADLIERAPLYSIPNLAGEGVIRMKLMWIPLTTSIESLTKHKLKDCIRSIYKQSIGLSADDPFLQAVLGDIV